MRNEFSDPAANASERVHEVMEQYDLTHAKLLEFRQRINNATSDANMATSTNAVNRKTLADLREALAGRRTTHSEVFLMLCVT